MKSLLDQERIKYQPSLPPLLHSLEALVVRKEAIASEAPQEIATLFPKTSHQPRLYFEKGAAKAASPLKVGVVLSGGQAPGGHNVIAGLFDALKKLNSHSRLIGFVGGPAGIHENHTLEITESLLAPYRNTGGFDLIGSGRAKVETEEQLAAAVKNATQLGLDGLVIIGGDDSNTNAALLAEYFSEKGCPTRIIGVPKTIDGDLKNSSVEISFGFDTASKIYSEMIGNIARDACSSKKYTHFIKLMGRSASHIALECALQTHPNLTLIGEEIFEKKMTLKEIVGMVTDLIVLRSKKGKNFGVILIPEGLIEFIPEIKGLIRELNMKLAEGQSGVIERLTSDSRTTFLSLPKSIQEQLLFDRDPHGNIQVSHISTEQLLLELVKKELKERKDFKGKFHALQHFLGYEGRCGFPSNFDANYCTALGMGAALLVHHGVTGYMSVVHQLHKDPKDWEIGGFPIVEMMDFEERKGKRKPVIRKTLVDLNGKPFKTFAAQRESWMQEESYLNPGPIQFFGPSELTNMITMTLRLERG